MKISGILFLGSGKSSLKKTDILYFPFSCFIKYLLIFIVVILFTSNTSAQIITVPADTVDLEDRELETEPEGMISPLEREKYYSHSPRRASLYSAVLPGLGQAYNKKYWKIPILYVGSGVLIYFIDYNHQRYVKLKSALFTHLNNEGEENWVEGMVPVPGRINPVPEDNVRRQIDNDRRNRDYLIIMTGIVYMLNIADAMVDAHLKGFDLGEDLSLKVKPSGGVTNDNTRYAGLSLTLKF